MPLPTAAYYLAQLLRDSRQEAGVPWRSDALRHSWQYQNIIGRSYNVILPGEFDREKLPFKATLEN